MPPKPHRVLLDRVTGYADEASAYLRRRRLTRRPFARVYVPGGRTIALRARDRGGPRALPGRIAGARRCPRRRARLNVAMARPASFSLAVLGLLAVTGFALAAPSAERSVKPGSLGSKCGVFPRPGPEVGADAASLDDQRAWNQDVSSAPRDAELRRDHHINLGGDLHPDFGSPREYGIPYAWSASAPSGSRSSSPPTATSPTAAPTESR